MKIDHNSYGSVALVYLIGGVLAALLVLFVHSWVFWPLLVLISEAVGQFAFSTRYPVGVITGIIGAPYLICLLAGLNRKNG